MFALRLPLLRAALSARQLDADRFVAKDSKDNNAEPARAWPTLRMLISGATPATPDAGANRIHHRAGQVLGGRPLQDIAAELHTDGRSWTVHRLSFARRA